MFKKTNMNKMIVYSMLITLFWLSGNALAEDSSEQLPEVPVVGTITLLDFGATTCIPCKILAPIMKDLKEQYKGKAAIYFVNVRKYRDLTIQHRIRTIPTLVFFDKNGKEVSRHEGFMERHFIERKLQRMLFE